MKRERGHVRIGERLVKGLIWGTCGVMLLWMIFGITVSARVRMEREANNLYYQQQEKILVSEVRDYLSGKGFPNSGVTLTRIVYQDGATEYCLRVHHGGITKLPDQEKQELLESLGRFTFEGDNCSFSQEWME